MSVAGTFPDTTYFVLSYSNLVYGKPIRNNPEDMFLY